MNLVANGDFSAGLNGWTVEGAGDSSPTYDAASGAVIYGYGNNDVQDGDRLSQQINLVGGQEYTVTFTITETGPETFGGFGITIDIEDSLGSGFTTIGSEVVEYEETKTVSITFISPYDDPILRFRGQYGFGTTDNWLVLDDISVTSTAVTCFTPGTNIDTPQGPVAVEKLQRGDLVQTVDHGPQEIKWIGTRTVNLVGTPSDYKLRPIIIRAGALGSGLPTVDIRVSRQHRMLVSSKIALRMFGEMQVLVAAVRLLDLPGIEIDHQIEEVTYIHIMFDQHQIIHADGAPTESLFLGPQAIKALPREALAEINALFPGFVSIDVTHLPARIIPEGKRQTNLLARHALNKRSLLSETYSPQVRH